MTNSRKRTMTLVAVAILLTCAFVAALWASGTDQWLRTKAAQVPASELTVEQNTDTGGWSTYSKTTGQRADFTGLAQNSQGWWYVKNGDVDFTASGVYENITGWWRVEDGKVNFKFNGFAANQYGSWFIEDGKVSLYYTGQVVCNDTLFQVTKGKVTSMSAVGASRAAIIANNATVTTPNGTVSSIIVPATGITVSGANGTTIVNGTTAKTTTKTTKKATNSTTEYIEVITDPPSTAPTTKATTKATTSTSPSGSSNSSSSGSSSNSSSSSGSSSSGSSSSSPTLDENELPIVAD